MKRAIYKVGIKNKNKHLLSSDNSSVTHREVSLLIYHVETRLRYNVYVYITDASLVAQFIDTNNTDTEYEHHSGEACSRIALTCLLHC